MSISVDLIVYNLNTICLENRIKKYKEFLKKKKNILKDKMIICKINLKRKFNFIKICYKNKKIKMKN